MELTRHITSAMRQLGLWVGMIFLGLALSLPFAPVADAQPTTRNISVDIFDWYFINLRSAKNVETDKQVPIISGRSSIVVEYMFRFEDSNPNHAFDTAQRDGAGKWETTLGTLPDYYYCRHLTGGDDSGPCMLERSTADPQHLKIPVRTRMYTEIPWLGPYACKEYSIVLGIWPEDTDPSNPNNGGYPAPTTLTHRQPNKAAFRTSFDACIPGTPRTPSGLRLTEIEGTDTIRLTWNELDTNNGRNIGYGEFVGYQVEYRPSLNGAWETVRRPFDVDSNEHTSDGKNTTYETAQWTAGEQNSWRIRTVTRVKLRTSRSTARGYANTFAWDISNRPSNNNVFPAPEFRWHYFFSDWDTRHWTAPTAGTPNRPPENFSARTNDDGNYVLTWDPPSNAASVGGITSYTLERLNDDGLVVDTDTITPPTFEHVFGEGDADVPALGSGYRWVLTGTGPNGTTPPARLTFGTHGAPRIPSVGGAVGGALSVRLNWVPAQGDRGDTSIDAVQWRVRYRPTGNTTAWTVLPLFGNAFTRSRTVAIPEIGIIVLELAAVNAAGIGGTATATPTVTKPAGSVAPTLTDPESARHSRNSVSAELRGPTTVYLDSTVYYDVSQASNVRIGAAASNLTRTDPLNEISGRLTPINNCEFDVSPPPIICVIRPPGSTSFVFSTPRSNRDDYRVRYWFPNVINGTSEGVPKNHRLEIKVTPDRSHIGSTFDVGWHPQIGSSSWGEGAQSNPKITVTIAEPTGNPNPPQNLSVSVNGAGNYVLTWDAPILATAYGVDAYVVQPYVGGVKQPSHQITSRTYTQASTSANQVYAWTVKAKAGSDESVESERLTEGLPNPPRDFTSLTGSTQMELSWRLPAGGRGLPPQSYTIDRYNNNTSQWEPLIPNIHIATTSHKLTSLTNGDPHRLTIVSVNGSYRSVRSGEVSDTPSVALATVPSPPQHLEVETRNRPATFALIWAPPISDGRAPLTEYRIKLKVGIGATNPTSVGRTTKTAFLVTSEDNSIVEYDEETVVQVFAVNAVGESDPVEVTTQIPIPLSSEPRLVVATTNRQITALTWTLPHDTGGEAIIAYVVERRVNREDASWTTIQSTSDAETRREYLDRQLQLGTTYEYRVSAHTENGPGLWAEGIVPVLAGVDFNFDGTVDADDARIMYYAFVLRDVVGDGGTGFNAAPGFQSFRSQLIAPIMGLRLTTQATDIDAVLAYANHWRQVGADQGGDFDGNAAVDQHDALILYYALEFAERLGDGTTGGEATERLRLLGDLLSTGGSTPTDQQLQSVLQKIHEFIE